MGQERVLTGAGVWRGVTHARGTAGMLVAGLVGGLAAVFANVLRATFEQMSHSHTSQRTPLHNPHRPPPPPKTERDAGWDRQGPRRPPPQDLRQCVDRRVCHSAGQHSSGGGGPDCCWQPGAEAGCSTHHGGRLTGQACGQHNRCVGCVLGVCCLRVGCVCV